MRIRNITIIVFLIAAIGLANISCNNAKGKKVNISAKKSIVSQKQCVDFIMKQDDSLGTIRNHFCETSSLSETITQYANSLTDLDFSDCPNEFTSAFNKHIEAWRQMLPIANQNNELRGELHALFDKIEVSEDSIQFKIKLKGIWDTWADIEKAIKDQ